MRIVFSLIRLGPKTSVFEMNVNVVSTVTDCDVTYHLGGNDYSFDALQAYCFGINIKL